MKKYKLILFLSTALLSVACTDSFFDLEPSSSVPTDKVYKTAEDFNVAVIGCYSKLQTQVSYFTECCEYRSDNLTLSAPTAGTQDRYDIDQFADKASNGILEDAWANFNNGVYRCNLVLDRIDEANFDATLKKQYKGEALFIRALTYFNMYRLWGGIPMTNKVVTVAEALKIGRSSDQQVYDFLVGDLNQVINENMLPSSYTSADMGRVTSGAAMALLGKIYLTFHKWTEARNVLSQLVGRYSLMTTPEQVFDVNNKMNDEIIFAVRFNKDVEGEGHGYWFSIINLTDDTNQTKSLKECYKDGDKRKNLITYVKVEDKVCVMNKFKDVKSATYNTVGNDQIILRYADVLLMNAEAAYHQGKESEALDKLEMVRQRARNSTFAKGFVLGKGSTYVNTGYSNNLPKVTTTGQELLEAIWHERSVELALEDMRYWDLVRTGRYLDRLDIVRATSKDPTATELRFANIDLRANCTARCIQGPRGVKDIPIFPLPGEEAIKWNLTQIIDLYK